MVDQPNGNRMVVLINDIDELAKSNGWDARSKFEDKYKTAFMKTLGTLSEEEKGKLDDVICAAIRSGNSDVLEYIVNPLFDKRKLIEWKNRQDLIYKIVDVVIATATSEAANENNCHFTGFMTKFLETLKGHQIIGKHANKLYTVIRTAMKTPEPTNGCIHNATLPFIIHLPWVDFPDLVVETVSLIKEVVKHNPDVPSGEWLATNLGIVYAIMFRTQTGKTVHMRALNDTAEIFNYCAQQDFQYSEDPSKKTICYELLKSIMEDFHGSGSTTVELVKPMMDSIRELWECGDEILQRDANYIMTAMADKSELVGDQTTEVLLEQFLEGKQASLASKLVEMYKSQPALFYPLLPRFLAQLNDEGWYRILLIQLFTEVAKTAPEKMPKETVHEMVKMLKDSNGVYSAIMFLDVIAPRDPKAVIKYDDQLVEAMNSYENASSMVANLFAKLSINEAQQRKYLKIIGDQVKKCDSGPHQIGLIYAMRVIGVHCPKILGEHKPLFEKLRERADLKDSCQSNLDVIEGRTLENFVAEISEQRKDISHLDTRVTDTEGNVQNLTKEVDKNKADIKDVKQDVKKQGQQLDELQTVVDETVEKVEEIDHKTLSHAPAWSIDVAKMLNPPRDRDWRLLASRLGYSNEDIRNWATQPNPCLSMFDEWFATHKTREATYGILKILVEMDRTDASVKVEEALKNVEHVVEDEDEEPDTPPPVFLSYQWAHQQEVKLLKKHLGMAGYSSWMDIGQMGGGDKLFAKIDKGIRAAKVIVCCVTERYAESPNCNREVNLSVTLGKPVIPLLMEKMAWPPPGSMGPIFGEYIFVRFFQRPEEATGDERYWANDKFTELLMQLRYNIAPDNKLITTDSVYKNWWQPPEEVIVIKPKNNKPASGQAALPSAENPEKPKFTSNSPEVFLSYQWGKQPQIKALYKRLSERGYSCWLDIMQMGGGDSLYDKIDKGIRGCKVIVSCVTSKYALSANCRREVSLADAIKKPIIPLLLEKSSWPPEGPMGMVFTQLVYIDCCKPKEDIQNDWNCPQFNELIKKIEGFIPPASRASNPTKPSTASETPRSQPSRQTISDLPSKIDLPTSTTPRNGIISGSTVSRPQNPATSGSGSIPPRNSSQSTSGTPARSPVLQPSFSLSSERPTAIRDRDSVGARSDQTPKPSGRSGPTVKPSRPGMDDDEPISRTRIRDNDLDKERTSRQSSTTSRDSKESVCCALL